MLYLTALLLVPAELEIVPSKDFLREAQISAIQATVAILNHSSKQRGTGVILRTPGPFVYVLTAEHLVAKGDRLELWTFTESSYPKLERLYTSAEVMATLKDQDLALLRLPTRERMPGAVRLCPPRLIPADKSFPVLTVGCSLGEPPTCLVDRVVGKKLVRKQERAGTSCVWELTKEHAPGRSGGPLLDKRGYLLGICSGTTDQKGYYCHIDEIHGWLKQSGLQWLYEEPGAK